MVIISFEVITLCLRFGLEILPVILFRYDLQNKRRSDRQKMFEL